MAEANVVGISHVLLMQEISNIGVTREMENLDCHGLLSIMVGHVAEHVDTSHFLMSTVGVTQIIGTMVIIPKVGGKLHICRSAKRGQRDWVVVVPSLAELASDSQVL